MTKVLVRAARGARALPRTLAADLWTGDRTAPGAGRRPAGDWLPAVVVLLVVCAALAFAINAEEYAGGYGMGPELGFLLSGVQAVSLVAALFRPLAAWWGSTLAMAAVALLAGAHPLPVTTVWPEPGLAPHPAPWTAVGLAVHIAVLFMVALRVRLRVAAEVLVLSVAVALVCASYGSGTSPYARRATLAALVVAGVLGAALRGRQVARTALEVQEELTAEERARRTLLEERNRIARELHDVVAHHMSVISIQAQVAPHLVADPPDELKENLAGIRQNAVEALAELRRVLGVLRSEDALAHAVRHAPQPSLAQLDELLANVRGAGLGVTAGTTGRPRPLAPGVELSAYRIVQESLSNVMRHAPGAHARVELGYARSGLTVRVTNTPPDRPAVPSPGAGHGLLGMRERTAMLGGDLAAGPTPDGGFEVTALLPAAPPGTHTTPGTPDAPRAAHGSAPTAPTEDTA
ncbi:sensor histidine kinase [Streptomyces sp. NPDC051310]|uniref:sensor histidine kinase n=1 Tax=Streptomyces sp. NPDC051310 TaxID=3365649 RepID=UPI0037B45D48